MGAASAVWVALPVVLGAPLWVTLVVGAATVVGALVVVALVASAGAGEPE